MLAEAFETLKNDAAKIQRDRISRELRNEATKIQRRASDITVNAIRNDDMKRANLLIGLANRIENGEYNI